MGGVAASTRRRTPRADRRALRARDAGEARSRVARCPHPARTTGQRACADALRRERCALAPAAHRRGDRRAGPSRRALPVPPQLIRGRRARRGATVAGRRHRDATATAPWPDRTRVRGTDRGRHRLARAGSPGRLGACRGQWHGNERQRHRVRWLGRRYRRRERHPGADAEAHPDTRADGRSHRRAHHRSGRRCHHGRRDGRCLHLDRRSRLRAVAAYQTGRHL